MAMSLREQRERAYLSTRELAEQAGVSPATIWRIERGEFVKLRPATMRKIAKVLEVHPSEIAEFVPRRPDTNVARFLIEGDPG